MTSVYLCFRGRRGHARTVVGFTLVAVAMYSLSKSAKEISDVRGVWHSSYSLSTKVYAIMISYNDLTITIASALFLHHLQKNNLRIRFYNRTVSDSFYSQPAEVTIAAGYW
jgi:hypothetical protein